MNDQPVEMTWGVEDLWVRNDANHPILRGISFELRRGAMTGIVGESGSGKSTLGLALLGHFRRGLQPVHGRVWCDGRDLLPLSVEAGCGFVKDDVPGPSQESEREHHSLLLTT